MVLERIRLATDLEQARVARETEQLRSALLASVSHDLRTPLAAITGSASTSLELDARTSAQDRRLLLEGVVSQAGLLRGTRDTGVGAHPALTVGGLHVDRARHQLRVDERKVAVSRKEFELLALLAAEPGRAFTHRQILDRIWGEAHAQDVHYQRVLVRSLRRKLDDDATAPRFVHTVQGVGYARGRAGAGLSG